MSVVYLAELRERIPLDRRFGPQRSGVTPAEGFVSDEWSPRRRFLFLLGASIACWALVLLPIYALIQLR